MTLDDTYLALHRAARAHDGGIRALARQTGKREKTLYSKLDPHDETHEPTLGEFAALLMCLDEVARLEVIEAFVAMFGLGLTTRTTRQSLSLVQGVLDTVAEHADIARTVNEALADGEITPRERADILRECAEARRAIQVLENTVRATG
jgi:hypothetical protein